MTNRLTALEQMWSYFILLGIAEIRWVGQLLHITLMVILVRADSDALKFVMYKMLWASFFPDIMHLFLHQIP